MYLLALLAVLSEAWSSALVVERLDVDRLPNNAVSALAQDSTGFLWIGTQAGLVRYDGYQERTFSHDADDPGSLSGNYVRSLHVENDGHVWAGTLGNGLSVFDPASERFRTYGTGGPEGASLSNERVESIASDGEGGLWLGTYGGLDHLDPATGRVTHHREITARLADVRIRAVLRDSGGRLWIGGWGGLDRVDPDGSQHRIAGDPGDLLAGIQVFRLFEASDGSIWVGTFEQGLVVIAPDGSTRPVSGGTAPDQLGHPLVIAFAEPEPGTVWVGTFGGGLDVLDRDSLKVLRRLRHDPADIGSLADNAIGSLLVDRSGLLWVGTWGHGLNRLDPRPRGFAVLRASSIDRSALSYPDVFSVLATREGPIWIGTRGQGIEVFDPSEGITFRFRPSPASATALADGQIKALHQSPDGTIWVGTIGGGLHRHLGEGRFERITRTEGLPNNLVESLTSDAERLWVGTDGGLASVDLVSGTIATFRHDPDDPGSLPGNVIESVAVAPDGRLWVGTNEGLARLDPSSGQVERFEADSNDPSTPTDDHVNSVLVDRDGRLWVASAQGIDRHDESNGRFEAIHELAGLDERWFENLLQDDAGRIWLIADSSDVVRISPDTWDSVTYAAADGVHIGNTWTGAHGRGDDGRLYFGGTQGLLLVDPDAVKTWAFEPPVVATGLRVNGLPRPLGDLAGGLVLTPDDRGFSVEFAALDLSEPLANGYRYRLDGFDDDWILTDAEHRTATYTGLRPGTYRLRIRGSNRRGLEGTELIVPVRTLAAFHETRWFQALVLLLVAASVAAAFRLRLQTIERRRAELEEEVRRRTEELREANRKLATASRTDPLTGLLNRRGFREAAETTLAETAKGFAVALADIDDFKQINDRYGHDTGDRALVAVTASIHAAIGSNDLVGRWGGEEFVFLLPEADPVKAIATMDRLREAVGRTRIPHEGGELSLTVTIGVTDHAPDRSLEASITRADKALYRGKSGGKNRVTGSARAHS